MDEGVKVALMYGDRDYACNWIGGENVSLNIPWKGEEGFRGAGYADLVTNSSYRGGLVRQYGNLSFSRVFEAGHEVPAYQPETAWRIFHRAVFGLDIATGIVSTDSKTDYSTQGPSSSWGVKNEVPVSLQPQCYTLNLATCTTEEYESLVNGTAVVRDWIVVDNYTAGLFPGVGNGNGSASGTVSGSGSMPMATSKNGASGLAQWSSAVMIPLVVLVVGWGELN